MVIPEPVPERLLRSAALVQCRSYDPFEVRRAVRRGLDLLGSPERVIRPGDRILLKPNMLSAKEPERAVTTHPEVITAVGEMVLDCRGKVVLGDSPGGTASNLEKYWEKTGFRQAAHRLGVEPVSFEDAGVKSFPAVGGHISISRVALEADGIINLPKLKTHLLTRMTGAVKNMFGAVPGYRKSYLHRLAPEALPFSRVVVEVYRQVVPALTVMDAVVGMEGNGPSSGNPRLIGAILVSDDALAVDSLAVELIGMDKTKVPTFQAAAEVGLWDWNDDEVTALGEEPAELIVPDFKQPDVSRLERIPPFVHHSLKRLLWIRPRANPHLCTGCGTCVENCPEQAMKFKNSVPKIDYSICIKCGCCDELCPDNAIYQEISLLARLLS